jgi:hypothetical protein
MKNAHLCIAEAASARDFKREARKDFLLQMYTQTFSNINRHILVVWQCVGVVIGAFAAIAVSDKRLLPVDYVVTLELVLVFWLLAHILDANNWYLRNLAIITNVEKQLLFQSDLRDIHYLFGIHRPNRMITHLRIQVALGLIIGSVVLLYHFLERVLPGFGLEMNDLQLTRALPYLMLVAGTAYVLRLHRRKRGDYEEFISNSPGKSIDTSDISYSRSHGHRTGV